MPDKNTQAGHTTDPRLDKKSYGDISASKSAQRAAENARKAGRNA